MKHVGLFEGIGGFSLAARWMEWETVAWCEWNPFCQKVLKHHFPEAEGFGDITKTNFTKYANRVDILTGGFPCQNISIATNAKGIGADFGHSGLWREMLRAAIEIKPRYIVIENSSLLPKRGLNNILYEFANIGYDAEWHCVQGFQVGVSQRRKRTLLILYPVSIGNWLQERKICTGWHKSEYPTWGSSEDRIYGVVNGVSNRVDRHRALGNSLIPLIPYQIYQDIQIVDAEFKNECSIEAECVAREKRKNIA